MPDHVADQLTASVSRRSYELGLRPGFIYRDDPLGAQDSGWVVMVGDESAAEADDPRSIVVQPIALLVGRWPELGDVFDARVPHRAWEWREAFARYVPSAR